MFYHSQYLCIKILYKRVVLQNKSNKLQAIITERTKQKRRNGAKEKSSGSIRRNSMNVRTNIGKTFLKLMSYRNRLHKIFNKKNTLKVSYSCMGNMASTISSHNRTILNLNVSLEYGCNCRSRNECPF